MSKTKPLTFDETPEEYRDRILFDTFRLEDVPQASRAHKKYAVVDVICDLCKEPKRTPVNDIRNAIRGRRRFPGTHRKCKYPGVTIHTDGYRLIWMPEHPNANGRKYVSEHIYVMSEYLGRPIDTQTESVHHINGDKLDNRIENLQLRKSFHGKGQAWECQDCGSHNVKSVALKE